jgi:hypothetical protein
MNIKKQFKHKIKKSNDEIFKKTGGEKNQEFHSQVS